MAIMSFAQAGVGSRIKAFAYDYVLILAYLAALALIGTLLRFGPLQQEWLSVFSTPQRVDLLVFLTTVLPVAAYFVWSEGSQTGATWGKRRVGLRVVGHWCQVMRGGHQHFDRFMPDWRVE